MDLYVVRHGETEANRTGIVQGWLDTDLNERGKAQVKEAAALFNEDVDAIYSSDLKRATQTADEFRDKYPSIPYFEDERLRERNFGDATGAYRTEHNWEQFWASNETVSIPNAETLDDYNERVESFIDTLKASGFMKVLITTHSGTINRLQDLTSTDHRHTTHGNASVTQIRI